MRGVIIPAVQSGTVATETTQLGGGLISDSAEDKKRNKNKTKKNPSTICYNPGWQIFTWIICSQC